MLYYGIITLRQIINPQRIDITPTSGNARKGLTMTKFTKEVGHKNGSYGEIEFSKFDSLEEMNTALGADVVFNLAARQFQIDCERVARDSFKGENPKSIEEVQAIIDAYKPGLGRSSKPTMKNLMAYMMEFSAKGKTDEVTKAIALNAEGPEGVVNACEYLQKCKAEGALAD